MESELVKFPTRSWIVSYVGKVVTPGDWDNIIRNVIFRGREGESFYDIHKSCHVGCPGRSANKLVNLPVPNTGLTARTYSKIECEFDFGLYKLG